jgi:gliding motility-associated-like protein
MCSNYTLTLSATGGIAPYTYTYTINGVTTTTTGGSSITIQGPSVFAPTTYTFSGVSVSSSANSGGTLTGGGTVAIYPLQLNHINASQTSVCQNAPSPVVTMTSNSNGQFYYQINGVGNSGSGSGSNSSGSLSLYVPTSVPGSYTYTFYGTSANCPLYVFPSVTVVVKPMPTATISGTTAVCQNSPAVVTLTGANGTAPYTFTYKLNGGANQTISSGSGSTASIIVPTSTPGAYVYTLVSVTSAGGCSQTQTGTATVVVNSLPNATISGTTTVCQNGTSPTITFTGSLGAPPYSFTYNINGGPNQTISSGGGNTATVPISTSTSGVSTYNLVSVTSNGCSKPVSGSAVVTVNPMPTATISGTASVCQGAVSPQITFTGANGTAPYVFTYKLNGGANQTISSGAGSTATINVPTSTSGTFTYSLVSVSATGGCNQTQTGTATVTVNPLPTATISGTTTICQNTTSPTITFTGANGTAPYTFTYNVNGGAAQTVSSGAGTTAAVTVPTSTAGTLVYNLISVSNVGCSQAQTGSATVTINSSPAATLSADSVVCQNDMVGFVFSGSGGNAPYVFTYSVNGGATQTIASNTANLVTYYVIANSPGTLTFDIFSVTNQQGCTAVLTETAQVLVNPLPAVSGDTLICEGTTTQWTGAGTPNAVNPWVSSNTSVATVDNSGFINAIAPGTAIITYTNDFGCSRQKQIVVQTNPVISGEPIICPGTTEQYLVNGSVENGLWTSSDLMFATIDSDGIVSALNAGNVTLEYIDTVGCSATFDVEVNSLPAAQLTGVDTICSGESTSLQLTGTPNAVVTLITGFTTQSVVIPSGGTVTIDSGVLTDTTSFELTDVQWNSTPACPQTLTDSVVILVKPLPQLLTISDVVSCPGEMVNSIAFSSVPAGSTFNWINDNPSIGLAASGSGDLPSFTISNSPGDVATITVSPELDGCAGATENFQISVSSLPVADAGADVSACANDLQNLQLGGPADPANTYSWSPAAGLSDPNSSDPFVIGGQATGSTYYLSVTNPEGCVAVDSVEVIVFDLPQVAINASGLEGCAPVLLQFTATETTGLTYQWQLNDEDILSSDSAEFAYTFTSSGLYEVSVEVEDANGCINEVQASGTISIYPQVVADFTFSPEEATVANPEFEFTNLSENAVNYAWDFGNGDSSTEENPVYTYAETAGEYEVMLIAGNAIGCSDTAIANIVVRDEMIVYVPNTFTPGGDGVNETFFPVITAGFEVSDYRFDIYNRWGELIFTSTDRNEGWNGTYRSLKCKVDTYVWVLRLTESGTTNVHSLEGHVNILK